MTVPYLGRTAAEGHGLTLWARLEALGISTDFLPGVLTARKIEGGIRFGLGSTLAVERKALAAAGARRIAGGQRRGKRGRAFALTAAHIRMRDKSDHGSFITPRGRSVKKYLSPQGKCLMNSVDLSKGSSEPAGNADLHSLRG